MSEEIYIYGLYHPKTNELRYIGKAKNLTKRLWHHIKESKGGQRTHKAAWIRKLLKQGLKPIIKPICKTTKENWRLDEKHYIAQAKEDGVRLTNLTEGGDGIPGYKHSDETKEKIRNFNIESGKTPPNWGWRRQTAEHIRKRFESRKKTIATRKKKIPTNNNAKPPPITTIDKDNGNVVVKVGQTVKYFPDFVAAKNFADSTGNIVILKSGVENLARGDE